MPAKRAHFNGPAELDPCVHLVASLNINIIALTLLLTCLSVDDGNRELLAQK